MAKGKQPDKKKECGICTGLIFTVLCPSCKLCSRLAMTRNKMMMEIVEPEYDEVTAQKISEAHELAKRKAGKLDKNDTKVK
jgi:hypothetical protein